MAFKAGFLDNPIVELLPGGFKSRPYKLHQPLVYYSEIAGQLIVVPAGYQSDLLSIPWFFRRLFPKGGHGSRASIVHDYLCDEQPIWSTGSIAAEVFDEAMALDFVPRWKRKMMYWAVRAFGPQWP